MSREDTLGMTREELEVKQKSLEEEIDNLSKAEVPDITAISNLQDELDEVKEGLNNLALEGEYDSRVSRKSVTKDGNDGLTDDKVEKRNNEEALEQSKNEEALRQQKIEEANEEKDKMPEQENLGEVNDDILNSDDSKLTLTQWQQKTGIDILADNSIKNKYPMMLTEQDFRDVLAAENVPMLIKEPGEAEKFLKTAEDWESVRTSKSAIDKALKNGNLPTDVNEQSYVLMEYNNDEIRDTHENKDEDGHAVLDKEDVYGKERNDEKAEDEELKDDNNYNLSESEVLKYLQPHTKLLDDGTVLTIYLAQDIIDLSNNLPAMNGILSNSVNMVGSTVGIGSFEKVNGSLNYDTKDFYENGVPPIENDGKDIENDDGEIPYPNSKNNN